MDRSEFSSLLKEQGDAGLLLDTCRKHLLHGTPYVFAGREDEFFEFRRRIAQQFSVGFHEVFVVGSAKLGFSPYKNKEFDLESDIDVVIISKELFDKFLQDIKQYQMDVRRSRRAVTVYELNMYHSFLEYIPLGWIRPDKLPRSFNVSKIKKSWFSFFNSISNGKSEVGNYKVTGAVWRSYLHLEDYLIDGLRQAYEALTVKEKA